MPRLGSRSFAGLVIIGGVFLIDAVITGYAVRLGASCLFRIPVLAALLVLNVALYWASFTVLTPKDAEKRALIPGAIVGRTVFTALLTLGTGLISHQLKNASNTYGTFGSVIRIVAFLLLLAKLSLYAAKLSPVLHRRLYPRALPMGRDDRRRPESPSRAHPRTAGRPDEHIGVGYPPDPVGQATVDAERTTTQT